jgi:hypothetical protein
MKRTTVYLQADLEFGLKREARRQNRPMAELIRDAIQRYLGQAPDRLPPGAGAFDSGRSDTSIDIDAALSDTGFGKKS